MARTRLTNPEPLVDLKYNPYQVSFLVARRLRACAGTCVGDDGTRLTWSMLESLTCPSCGQVGMRPYRRFFLRAGRRGGKTRIGALSAVEEATVPHSIGWCCAPSYPELEDYVMPAFFSTLPQEWFEHPLTEWSEDRLSLRLPNMAFVHFRSLDDPNRAAGPGLHWAWIDEGRKIQELAWHLLSPTLKEHKGIAFVTSSPDWGEDWCHRNFWLPAEQGVPGYWVTSYRTIDNPIIDPAEVERDRRTMPPELFRREYEASIEYPTGTIYGNAIDQADCSDEKIREWLPEWPRVHASRPSIVGIDPGTDHPFAAVLVVATPAGLVVIDEYLERHKPFFEHAVKLKMLHGCGPSGLTPRYGIDKSQAQGAIELAQHGVYAQAAPNAVDAGIQRTYAWMATGRMRIARSRCPRLIKQLRSYRYADVDTTSKAGLGRDAKVYKKDDDLPDALRYALMLWPELPRPNSPDEDDPQKRNLALLSDEARRVIERNLSNDPKTEDGLVRVTDDFQPTSTDRPLVDSSLSDFYS